MDQQLLEDTIHELTCRDRYMLTSTQVGMTIRGCTRISRRRRWSPRCGVTTPHRT